MKLLPSRLTIRPLPSPHHRDRGGNDADLIVIHHITCPPGNLGHTRDVEDLFLGRLDPRRHPAYREVAGRELSAHFLVDRLGRVTQFVDTARAAFHAGASRWKGREGCNAFSVGIELVGDAAHDFTARQYASLARLAGDLMRAHPRITPQRIVGHSDVALPPGRKADPGPHFDWERLRRLLATIPSAMFPAPATQRTASARPPRKDFLVFGAPALEEAEIREVVATLRSGWIGTGPKVARFESDFAAYKGAAHPVAVSSCTAALHLSLIASGVGPGDEVIVPALTFCATANAVIHAGATPVIADCDPLTQNLDPGAVRRRITSRTRAIVPVHFAGRPCDMDALGALARRHRLKIVEDCAHAIETEYRGRAAGTFGDFGCFSFYVTKNVTTAEGGMILARRARDAARLKTLALHGMTRDAWRRFGDKGYRHYEVVAAGFKNNMTDLQASLGLHQLARVGKSWRRRQQVWRAYDAAFRDLPVETPAPPEPGTRHAFHLYTLLVDKARAGISRDRFLERMTAARIGVGVHYLSLPEHPFYRKRFGWRPADCPNAMRIGRRTVSLPLSARLTAEDVQDVISAVRTILGRP